MVVWGRVDVNASRPPLYWGLECLLLPSGSQQFVLMKGITESLAGRVAVLELYPFSIKELKSKKKFTLEDVIWRGLYPEPFLYPKKRKLWVQSYIKTYVERDLRQLINVKDLRLFENFLRLSSAYHTQVFNASRISEEIGVSVPTIKSWAGVLEASHICFFLPPFYRNFRKRIVLLKFTLLILHCV